MALQSRRFVEPEPVEVTYCPHCAKAVPDWAKRCQFCGTPILARSETDPAILTRRGGDPFVRRINTKVWAAYYTSAACFVLGGVYEAVGISYVFTGIGGKPALLPNPSPIFGQNAYAFVLGVLSALFGILVFLDNPFIRRIAASVGALRLLVTVLLLGLFLFGSLNPGSKQLPFFLLSGGYAFAGLLMVSSAFSIASATKKR